MPERSAVLTERSVDVASVSRLTFGQSFQHGVDLRFPVGERPLKAAPTIQVAPHPTDGEFMGRRIDLRERLTIEPQQTTFGRTPISNRQVERDCSCSFLKVGQIGHSPPAKDRSRDRIGHPSTNKKDGLCADARQHVRAVGVERRDQFVARVGGSRTLKTAYWVEFAEVVVGKPYGARRRTAGQCVSDVCYQFADHHLVIPVAVSAAGGTTPLERISHCARQLVDGDLSIAVAVAAALLASRPRGRKQQSQDANPPHQHRVADA